MSRFISFWFQRAEPYFTYTIPKSEPYDVSNESSTLSDALLHWAHEVEELLCIRTSIYTLIGKRCMDIAVSLLVILFILSWLIPVVAILICVDSSGPFFFVQMRTGRKGRPFYCFKFRTMIHTAATNEFQQTKKKDTRVTRIGKFLRRTNIDETLQFINVFLGDMTLVGPRPHAVTHDAMHWESDAYRARYLVKPGITGLAQIRGARGETTHPQSMRHRVKYDHLYINRQTLWLDVKICACTVLLTLKGDINAW